jgi:putative glutamine amidotransferase
MKPIIGITGNYQSENNSFMFKDFYVSAIIAAGGTAILLPGTMDEGLIDDYLRICQGFVFSGGGDLDPIYWGEYPQVRCGEIDPLRDWFELSLARQACVFSKAVLGICRGCQILNVAAGGGLVQDIISPMSHNQKAPRNHPFHDIFIEKYSRLGIIVGDEQIRVNSFHHQAVKQPGQGLYVTAMADDGTIEAIESRDYPFCLGVQWHPECLGDASSARLFAALIAAALGKSQE